MEDFVRALNEEDLTINISPKGFVDLASNTSAHDPQKNIVWTTDAKIELPIILKKFGQGSETPLTLMDQWQISLARYGDQPALS